MATKEQINKFIAEIAPVIQKYARLNGYKICSTIIAQACCESNFGVSQLGYKYHNYFGMKCGSSWKGRSVNLKTKEEYKPGILTTIKDNFRVYDSMEDGVKGYFTFISARRYENLKTAETPLQFAELLKSDGYATSSKYTSTLINFVNRYDLTQFDSFCLGNIHAATIPIADHNPYIEPTTNVKKGTSGEGAKWVQWCLWRFGLLEESGIDGVIGSKSVSAIKIAQARLGLNVDGIVGKNTRTTFNSVLDS